MDSSLSDFEMLRKASYVLFSGEKKSMQLSTSCGAPESQTLIKKSTLNVCRIDVIDLLMLKTKHAP